MRATPDLAVRRTVGDDWRPLLATASWIALVAVVAPAAHAQSSTAGELAVGATPDEIYAAMFGAAAPKLLEMGYPVIVEGVNRGDVLVAPGDDAEGTLVDAEGLLQAVLPFLVEAKANEARALPTNGGKFRLSDLSRLGLKAGFDRSKLALVVDIPTPMRAEVPIPLQRRYNPSRSLKTVAPAPYSGVLNLFAGAEYVARSRAYEVGFERSSLEARGALNLGGWVLESGFSYLPQDREAFSRSETRLTRDFVSRAIRVEGGDLTGPVAGLQDRAPMAGLAAFRNFDLRPYDVVRPTPSQQFQLERPGRVSIFVNGQYQREVRLTAGRYRLTDLPLRSAAGNDIELEIRYDTGEVQRVVFAAFFDFELLAPGISEFAVNLGVTGNPAGGPFDYDDDPAVSAFYRRGLTETLTAGANVQANRDVSVLGGEVIWASPAGSLGLLTAWDVRDGPSIDAFSSSVFYRWNGQDPVGLATLELLASHSGDSYRTLGNPYRATPFKYDLSGRFGVNLNEGTRIQLAGQMRKPRFERDWEREINVSVSQRTRLGGVVLSAYREDSSNRRETGVRLSWSLRLGQASASAGYDSRDDTLRAVYSRLPSPGAGAIGYDVAYTRQSRLEELVGRGRYFSNRFEAGLEQRIGREEQSSLGSELSTAVFVSSAIVFADRQFALSRPVYDSFVMFDPHPATRRYTLAADPQGGLSGAQRRYSAFSSRLGPAVVPDISAYLVRSIQVDAPDAPAGVSVGGDVFNLLPSYRSGFRFQVGGAANVALIGRVEDQEGAPLALAAGYASLERDGEVRRIPIFTNASGRFYLDGVAAGERVSLEFEGSDTRADLQVPENVIGLVRYLEPVRVSPKAAFDGRIQRPAHQPAAQEKP